MTDNLPIVNLASALAWAAHYGAHLHLEPLSFGRVSVGLTMDGVIGEGAFFTLFQNCRQEEVGDVVVSLFQYLKKRLGPALVERDAVQPDQMVPGRIKPSAAHRDYTHNPKFRPLAERQAKPVGRPPNPFKRSVQPVPKPLHAHPRRGASAKPGPGPGPGSEGGR